VNAGGGNGIVGRIDIDGTTFWSQTIEGTDGIGVDYSVSATVSVGSTVDFVIDPFLANDRGDGTNFTATITQVPEPSTLILAALGMLGLLGFRWRRRSRA